MPDNILIYQQIPKILADVEAIGKTRKNQQQGFMYRGVDDVLNALSPLFARHQVFVTTQVTDEKREERATQKGGVMFSVRLTCEFTLFATDGSHIMCRMVGEAMDSGDKATSKAASVAYRNAMFQLFCIPTEEADADAGSPEVEPVLSKADQAMIAEGNTMMDAAKSPEELATLGEDFRNKPARIRAEWKPYYMRRMESLKAEAEDNRSLETAAHATK